MLKAVGEAPDVVLHQTVYAGWSRTKAEEQMTWLLQRHPQARLVWTGSDLMAFGAMDALSKAGTAAPGQGMWFSSVNTTTEAIKRLRNGQLTALAGISLRVRGPWSWSMTTIAGATSHPKGWSWNAPCSPCLPLIWPTATSNASVTVLPA